MNLRQYQEKDLIDYCRKEIAEIEKDINSAVDNGWGYLTVELQKDLYLYQIALLSLTSPLDKHVSAEEKS